MISQRSVAEIIETAKIEEVINDFISLKKRGINMIGLCPFHNEKTPSFTVSPTKNIYKCFGCGKGGNAVQFIMDHEQMNFPEALRYLAKKFNIEIDETKPSKEFEEERKAEESLHLVNQFAVEHFSKNLFDTDEGRSVGLSYFKERGYREATIKKFELGFASSRKDDLTLAAVNAGYNIELLRELRLTNQYDKDFFFQRVMFTLHNLSGKPIGFAGRILSSEKKIAKYVNSTESAIYKKSKFLYGAYFAKRAIRKEDECLLVEGYTDVITLHEAGVENVVASSGTSLTQDQIRLVGRYTKNIKMLYDGDPAGIKAALRGMDLILEQDMNVKIVLLPEGEDPDSLMKKSGADEFKSFIEKNAKDFILFKTSLFLEEVANDPIKKSSLVREIVESIARVPDSIKRSVYIKECSTLMNVDETVLVAETNKAIRKIISDRNKKRERADYVPPEEFEKPKPQIADQPLDSNLSDQFQERDLLRVLITAGHEIFDEENKLTVAEYIFENLEDVFDFFDNEFYLEVLKEYQDKLKSGQAINSSYFFNHQNSKIQELAVNLSSSPFHFSENWQEKYDIILETQKAPEENYVEDTFQIVHHVKLRKLNKLIAINLEQMSSADPDEADLLLKVHHELSKQKNEIAQTLKTTILPH